jgi:hypothetical protein
MCASASRHFFDRVNARWRSHYVIATTENRSRPRVDTFWFAEIEPIFRQIVQFFRPRASRGRGMSTALRVFIERERISASPLKEGEHIMIRSCAFVTMNSLVALSLVATMGCSAKSSSDGATDDGSAAAGSNAAQVESDSESFASMFASSGSDGSLSAASFSGGTLTTQGLPGGAANNFPNLYPAGCVVEAQDLASKTNTYTFNNCTGPWGFSKLNGTVAITWSSTAPTNLTLNFTASNFEINRAIISTWKATAVITATGNDRDMQWNGSFSGTTGAGREFNRVNVKDVKWTVGEQCIDISGQSTGDVTGKHLTTKVITYNRCAAECPEANSEINIQNTDTGNDVDIKFLGGASADVTLTANGKSESIDVLAPCGG